MSKRKTYQRPVTGKWWTKNPYYVRYMLREGTSVLVAIYSVLFTFGLAALAKNEAAWQSWLSLMRNPIIVIFHILVLIAALYHMKTWFHLAPKAVHLQIGAKKVEDKPLVNSLFVAFVIFTIAVIALAIWGGQ